MANQIPIPKKRLSELDEFRRDRFSVFEFKRFLCLWLRAKNGMSAIEIAPIVGCHEVTVRAIQRAFIARGKDAIEGDKRGGRNRQLMTFEEEKDLLEGFINAASDASMLVVNEVKAALEKKLGRTVHKTTMYRILKRHKWRKIAPRPSHPKQNKEAVEAFKKGAAQKG